MPEHKKAPEAFGAVYRMKLKQDAYVIAPLGMLDL